MSYIGSTPASQFFAPGTDTFSGDGTTVAFTLSRNVATVNDILVVVNNVDQQPSNYTVLNNVLTFSPAPSSGTNNIYVRYLSTNITAIVPSASGTANSTTFLRGDNVWAAAGGASTPAAVSDQVNTSTGYFDFPSGTTAQRPVSPPTGASRYNSTLNGVEFYDGVQWTVISSTYTSSYLVVAGGGGGGSQQAGGGGAGGLLTGTTAISKGVAYTVTVGAGGAGGASQAAGTNGSDSVFGAISVLGGGGGGGNLAGNAAKSGGSGGGGGILSGGATGAAGTSGQGFAGGNGNSVSGAGGGGGGNTAAGTSSAAGVGGAGGTGFSSSITGSSVGYAGGGGGGGAGGGAGAATSGGGAGGNSAAGTAGTANTGGGGGGGGQSGGTVFSGAAGGSGIVVIAVPSTNYSGIYSGTPTITTIGANTVLRFTSSGSYTG